MTTQEIVLETLEWLKRAYADESPDVKEEIISAIESIVSQVVADDLFKTEEKHGD